jgi:molybdenum cofactor guanylyltransferase
MPSRRPPIGVILAGGGGRRIGGSKAIVKLQGRPLITYPLAVLQAVFDDVAIVAKADTELPSLPGITVWVEPSAPQHPIVGIAHALALAGRRAVFIAAADMPFLTPAAVVRLATADPGATPAVIATHRGRIHPLLGCYQPQAAAPLAASIAGDGANVALTEAVVALDPRFLEIEDAEVLFNVNAPEDLLHAAGVLDQRINRR